MSNKTILFADDSATMRAIMEKTFAAEPYEVAVVPSGEAAIMKARELLPDIIVADAGMAGVSGYDVCKAIREDTSLKRTPFVIMTGISNPYDETRAAEVGVDDHVKKPFDTTQLIEKFGDLTAQAEQAEEIEIEEPETVAAPPVEISAGRPLTEKPAAAPMGPRPIATPVAFQPPSKNTMTFGRTSDLSQHAADAIEVGDLSSGAAPAVPTVKPIEVTEAVEADADAFQVSTLAEMAQMDEAGHQVEPEILEDAIELPHVNAPEAIQPEASSPDRTSSPLPIAEAVRERAQEAAQQVGSNLSGVTAEQLSLITALTRDVIEQVVWEIVPDLAETIIKEEIAKILQE